MFYFKVDEIAIVISENFPYVNGQEVKILEKIYFDDPKAFIKRPFNKKKYRIHSNFAYRVSPGIKIISPKGTKFVVDILPQHVLRKKHNPSESFEGFIESLKEDCLDSVI